MIERTLSSDAKRGPFFWWWATPALWPLTWKRAVWAAVGVGRVGCVVVGLNVFNAPAQADCIDAAAKRYAVNADLLRAVAYYESRLNPGAFHHNANGTYDVGLMQINSIHLPALEKQGITQAMLSDACVNARVGAQLLRQHINNFGATWAAVGEYHSHNEALRQSYAQAVYDIYRARPWALSNATAPTRAALHGNNDEPVSVSAAQKRTPPPSPPAAVANDPPRRPPTTGMTGMRVTFISTR